VKKVLLAVMALASLLVVATAAAAPAPSSSASNASGRYLVGFKATPGASERALVARHGGSITAEFREQAAFAISLPAHAVEGLERSASVSYVEPDEWRYPLGLADAQATPSMSNGLYGLLTTKSTTVHSRGVTGANTKACVADTGIDYTHADIKANYVDGIDYVSNDSDPWWNGDPNETHGTHVAGTVLGVNNTVGVYGVAYNAQLHYARVLGPSGGRSSWIMNGVKWLVEQKGCKIVNLSLGGGRYSTTEARFYRDMDAKGALIIAATGNDSATSISYPAGYSNNLAVGAVDANNVHASFSNTGTGIDISGPGVLVLSSVPGNPTLSGSEAAVFSATGTEYRAFGLEYAGRTAGFTDTLVDCGLATAASDCVNKPADGTWVALIQRGSISFADKVTNATAAGADAAILYNNASGDFIGTLGSAGSWIPAVSVSDVTGATLKSQVGSLATVKNIASAWDHMDGTSMATPHVSGVAALVWSANPALSDETVEDYLKATAQDLGPAGYDTTYGYGLVNADAAVAKTGK